jgi:UDP-N-acetylglucosamine 1-carboxyvinyltransferase
METLIVDGPTPLKGEIEVAGAKNSMSKLLTASMLTAEPCEFTNVPAIGDTEITKAICEALGAHCSEIGPKALLVETPDMPVAAVPEALAVQNRLSVMMLAPLVHRHGRAVVPAAGGDRIGPRPVDFHLEGYRMMGARVETLDDVYYVEADRLHGADITLPYPSVTATENLLMAATLARGRTFIRNAAIEPEVVDLALFLQKMGAIIDYHVDRTFIVEGVDSLKGTRHAIMPDRLVAASLGAAAVATGGAPLRAWRAPGRFADVPQCLAPGGRRFRGSGRRDPFLSPGAIAFDRAGDHGAPRFYDRLATAFRGAVDPGRGHVGDPRDRLRGSLRLYQ